MANAKHEDAVMKMGVDYFRDTILKSLGIDYDFVEVGPTELVELTIHSMYMDFTFLTKQGFRQQTRGKRIYEDFLPMMRYIHIRLERMLLHT